MPNHQEEPTPNFLYDLYKEETDETKELPEEVEFDDRAN
jgi:hypothetical protein